MTIDNPDDAYVGAIALHAGLSVDLPGGARVRRLRGGVLRWVVFGAARHWYGLRSSAGAIAVARAIREAYCELYGDTAMSVVFRGGVRAAVDGRAQRWDNLSTRRGRVVGSAALADDNGGNPCC
jgi:hypothetical protein